MNTSQMLTIVGLTLAVSARVHAQWTVVRLHPQASSESRASFADGLVQIGTYRFGGVPHACMWSGTPESLVDLHTPGTMLSVALAGGDGQQGGYYMKPDFTFNACMWSGTPESFVDLHPEGSADSAVNAVGGGRQGGAFFIDGIYHACLWSGTPESMIDLHPAGADSSGVYAFDGDLQIGVAGVEAGMWQGTPESWKSLHPAGAVSSSALGAGMGQQVGFVFKDGISGAALWQGTPESFVSLNPIGALLSTAVATNGEYQVGEAYLNSPAAYANASLWHGTAESWVDLHQFLPPEFVHSQATGVYSDGTKLYVTGWGNNDAESVNEAILWIKDLGASCAADCDGSGGLNIDDFICFQTLFALGDPAADCDASGQLNIDDFICFQTLFALGC